MSTLGIVALDAADYRLARDWNCDNLLLENHRELETFAYSNRYPNTVEVWTSAATGAHPEDHGLLSTGEHQDWRNPLLEYASKVAPYVLPKDVRVAIGTRLRGDNDDDGAGMAMRQTSHSHLFEPEGRVVRWWPGVTPGEHVSETWHWFNLASNGELSDAELWRRLYGNAGVELGWLQGMAQAEVAVAGIHMHVLDAAGHTFASHPDRLRDVYERVDAMVGSLRDRVGDLLIVSDHGMQVEWIDGDDEPGLHSWRALASTTLSEPPESVYDIRDWVDERADKGRDADRRAVMDTTEEQLRELGYLE
ncbi:alkaline phosphatase family protein [Halosolutus gelatinilyticus]|uniref:alkaline phosphatase family protein n=1 Tax=Halosolutus gelatinilyticus TaxID=2931975 RepID=UPI001FF14E69|nr:alkaline phosphatase family protein [Halosolutus gelatinilyticus]